MTWLFSLMLTITVTQINSKYGSPCLTPNQQSGLCMPVRSCKSIYDFLKQIEKSGGTISDEDKSRLATFHCGTFKNISHVCCPENEIQLNVEGLDILKNNTCGVYSVNTIANGQDAAPFQFPWMALLKYKDKINPFKCGGTLISDQYVLTAAHCIKGRENLLKEVRLGEYQISTLVDCTNSTQKKQCAPPVEDIEIEEMIIHENYQNVFNDIALIRLNRKVEFKRHIKPICLPIYEHLRSKEYKYYLITGWGKTEEGKSSDILMSAFLPKVNHTECENKLRKYNLRYPLNNGHICAGGMNLVDSCQGDSGGPLGYHDFYNERPRFIQFGIVSTGLYRCGVENVPGIYTNVSHYMQWITDNLKETSVNILKRDDSCTTPTLENGVCVSYKECSFLKELPQTFGSFATIPHYYIKLIIQSKCSRDNEPIRLCCKKSYNSVGLNIQTTATPVDKSNDTDPLLTEDLDYNKDFNSQLNPQGLSILNKLSCGHSNTDHHVMAGGIETNLGEYPWMALLLSDTPGNEFVCGGSLISNRYVLTVTHCVTNVVYQIISVRLGEHDITTNPDCKLKFDMYICNPVAEDFGIEKIVSHPRYNRQKRINDIALIKLNRNVTFKRHIIPVCLPIHKQSFGINFTSFTIAGWGVTEINMQSPVLLKARVFSYSRSVCQNVFSNLIELNQKHICAGDLETGRDSCRGDSGGPLVAFNTYLSVARFIQYGIIANGGEACNLQQGFPSIYTNVLTYLPWITYNIVD